MKMSPKKSYRKLIYPGEIPSGDIEEDLMHNINGALTEIGFYHKSSLGLQELPAVKNISRSFKRACNRASRSLERFLEKENPKGFLDSEVLEGFRKIYEGAISRLDSMEYPEDLEEAFNILATLSKIAPSKPANPM